MVDPFVLTQVESFLADNPGNKLHIQFVTI